MFVLRAPITASPNALPAWLDGCPDVFRRPDDGGDLVIVGDPITTPIPTASAAWHDLPEGWRIAATGAVHPALLLRRSDPRTPAVLPVPDAAGRAWHAPAILAPTGTVALPLGLTKRDGVWTRSPTPAQAALITAAQTARAEIESGRLRRGEVPLAVVADLAVTLLESVYHLTGDVLALLGLIDDALIVNVLMAASGHLAPTSADT